MANPVPIKLVLVGDGFVGKTSLITAYISGSFTELYVPTVADNCSHDISVDDKTVRLSIHDTAGQEDYDKLRQLSYKGTNVFLICYSVDSTNSFDNVANVWAPELRNLCGNGVPIVLVATKTDLRASTPGSVSAVQGMKLASELGASSFVECSALTLNGLEDVFRLAVRAHFENLDSGKKKRKKSACSLL